MIKTIATDDRIVSVDLDIVRPGELSEYTRYDVINQSQGIRQRGIFRDPIALNRLDRAGHTFLREQLSQPERSLRSRKDHRYDRS